jgi:membrane-associated HD superfamily phosphohydrolase
MQLTLKNAHRSTLITAGWILPIAIVFPFIVHIAPPYNGIPIGAYLLPMFYIPFIALVLYRLPVALIVAALAPIFNFILTGNPQWGFMGILTIELVFFTGLAHLLLHGNLKWFAAPLGYIGAKVVSTSLLFVVPLVEAMPFNFFKTSLTNAVAGILILFLINILAVKYLPTQKQGS